LWPQDLSENRLSGGADSPPQGAEGLRRVIFSDCALNPGDSGGPLLDENGRLIAVSFGGPAAQDLAKFSYHVHLDEVRGFLSDFPAEPQAFHIEAWPPAGFCQLVDLDQDERPETALFSVSQGGDLSGFLFDLDQDSKTKSCEELARGKEWDFEFAYHTTVASPFTQAFYDRDNDGSMDAIRRDADNDGVADLVLVRNKDRWKVAHTGDREVIRTDSFTDDELQKKLEEYLGLLHSALAGGGG
jgi:hypothetical protein